MKRWHVAAMVTLVVACGSPPQSAAPASPATAPPPQASAAPTTATPPPTQAAAAGTPHALDFTASLVGGGQIVGGDLSGGDVVLWFWAPG